MRHYLFLIPGMFGFSRLAGYDYFGHVRAALHRAYERAGSTVHIEVIAPPPTSSVRHRARIIARTIHQVLPDGAPVHLFGHSTGGVDVRLLLSPTADLKVHARELAWRSRVRTAISVNTPHYGSPLASYFATVSGTRVLYALSLLTIVSLSLGTSSLSVFARLLAGIGGVERLFGGDLRLISRIADFLLRYVDSDGRHVIETYLNKMRLDQGAIIQITPEAMDMFNAATEDDPRVRYACVATAAPEPKTFDLGKRIRSPYAALSAAMFSTLHTVTSQRHVRYGYARPTPTDLARLRSSLETRLDDTTNDAVVPTLSMLWGELLWCGPADHLDVIGHFRDNQRATDHVDWLTSGALFDRTQFSRLMQLIAKFQLDHA